MDALAAQLSGLATSPPPSLVEALDDDALRAIFSSCAGLPAVGFTTASPAAAVKLMRLAPVCRGFAQMAHVLVPKDVATEAKLQQMTLHLVGFFDLKDVAPWTAEMVVDDGYASMMEIAGWMAVNIDESWAQTNRIGRLLLNDREGCGGLEKVRKRIKMAPSNKGAVGRDELAAAYASLLETKEFFNAVRVLRRGGFVTAGCAGLLSAAVLRTVLKVAVKHVSLMFADTRDDVGNAAGRTSAAAPIISRMEGQLSAVRAVDVDELGVSEATVERALLDELLREALDGGRERGFFREALRALKRHAVVKNSATFAEWRSTTLAADHPLIAFRPDPATKGSRWLAVPGNKEKAAAATARKLESAEGEVPHTIVPPLYYTAALHPLSGRSTTIGWP